MNKPTLILTVGLPYSGKSTWARGKAMPVVNPDSIRLALHGQRFVDLAEPFVWAIAKVMVRSLFLAGHDTVIVDACHTTNKRRDFWLDSAWQLKFMVFSASKEVCLERAKNDPTIHPVIEKMAAEFEPVESTTN